jgi:hypothetical protein
MYLELPTLVDGWYHSQRHLTLLLSFRSLVAKRKQQWVLRIVHDHVFESDLGVEGTSAPCTYKDQSLTFLSLNQPDKLILRVSMENVDAVR